MNKELNDIAKMRIVDIEAKKDKREEINEHELKMQWARAVPLLIDRMCESITACENRAHAKDIGAAYIAIPGYKVSIQRENNRFDIKVEET